MEAKKAYRRPLLKSVKIELGVFGNYADGPSANHSGASKLDLSRYLDGQG